MLADGTKARLDLVSFTEDDEDLFPAPEPYQVPKDPKKIKDRIRRYERELEREKRREGDDRDGSGKRFLLGPLYLIAGDLEGTLKSFAWFEAAFPDSTDEAPHVLCWALALHRAGEDGKAQRMLRRTMLANLYIIDEEKVPATQYGQESIVQEIRCRAS